MKVALIGQPNCGKSTLFNSVAGYRSETSNFPGSTVNVARGTVRLNGMLVELVDVPGIYSLTSSNPAERAAKRFLLDSQVDLIINVLDASLLSRSLELTLELRELAIPMVLCLNMSDEAEHKGIRISAAQLAEKLQVPVVATVAPRGVGVLELFAQVREHLGRPPALSADLLWSRDVEQAIHRLEPALPASSPAGSLPARFRAIKLLEADDDLAGELPASARAAAQALREELGRARGRACEAVIMSERHDVAMRLSEQVAAVGRPAPTCARPSTTCSPIPSGATSSWPRPCSPSSGRSSEWAHSSSAGCRPAWPPSSLPSTPASLPAPSPRSSSAACGTASSARWSSSCPTCSPSCWAWLSWRTWATCPASPT